MDYYLQLQRQVEPIDWRIPPGRKIAGFSAMNVMFSDLYSWFEYDEFLEEVERMALLVAADRLSRNPVDKGRSARVIEVVRNIEEELAEKRRVMQDLKRSRENLEKGRASRQGLLMAYKAGVAMKQKVLRDRKERDERDAKSGGGDERAKPNDLLYAKGMVITQRRAEGRKIPRRR